MSVQFWKQLQCNSDQPHICEWVEVYPVAQFSKPAVCYWGWDLCIHSLEVSPTVDMQFMELLLISLLSVISCNTSYFPKASLFSSLARNLNSCSSRNFLKLYLEPNGGRTETEKKQWRYASCCSDQLLPSETISLFLTVGPLTVATNHQPRGCVWGLEQEKMEKRKTK